MLACLSRDVPEVGLPQLAQRLGWSKATVHRYASALERAGLLSYDERRQLYSIGPEVLRLASILTRRVSLQDAATPVMKRLTREVDVTTTLSVWLGSRPVVVRCESDTSRLVRWELPTGTQLPLDSAAGAVFQAFGDESTVASDQPELALLRRTGLAIHTGIEDGMRALAVPVTYHRELAAVLSLVGPIPTLPDSRDHPTARRLYEAGQEITATIGGADGRDHPDETMTLLGAE